MEGSSKNNYSSNESEPSRVKSDAVSRELATESLGSCAVINSSNAEDDPRTCTIITPRSLIDRSQTSYHSFTNGVPLLFIGKPSLIIRSTSPITSQPKLSLDTTSTNKPQSLFLQALSKLNESALDIVVLNHIKTATISPATPTIAVPAKEVMSLPEPSPPNSLTSAPPSYSFVLRQMATRRPRLMGTFIPSPSFITHTPPPNYATAFNIYVDNPVPTQIPRNYYFGFTPTPIVCPECGYTGLSEINCKITMCTHLCAILLCLFFCWVCAPLPYVLRSCKDVYHYCRNCRNYLGMYCPTNPQTV